MIWLLHPPLPFDHKQVVSLSHSYCVSPVEPNRGEGGGRGGGRSQIIQQRGSLVLYNTLNTLCNYVSYCTGIPDAKKSGHL